MSQKTTVKIETNVSCDVLVSIRMPMCSGANPVATAQAVVTRPMGLVPKNHR